MKHRIIQVDAFTDRPFHGNPAGVCLLEQAQPDAWMQNVALELNFSETAFLYRENGAYRLRWFTPVTEVALCGHATLASAHVLWEDGHIPDRQPAEFDTQSGRLTATRSDDWITLDFPAKPPEDTPPPDGLLEGLGVEQPRAVQRNVFDYLVEVDDAAQVRGLRPNFSALERVKCRGVMVTAASDEKQFDFISRFFAPAAGVNEDPVTGSAHCALGPYWGAKLGKNKMTAYQASKRGGVVRVELRDQRVMLGGRAITVLRGELIG